MNTDQIGAKGKEAREENEMGQVLPMTAGGLEYFVDVMVHLFEPATRAEYDLEMLWGDAPRIAWQREGK